MESQRMDNSVNAEATGNPFNKRLAASRIGALRRGPARAVQVNLGRVCNQACRHCHVDAGPQRTESMEAGTVDDILRLLEESPSAESVQLTGGAPELNPNFRRLARDARLLGKRVLDRSNLTVFSLRGQEDLPHFLADHQIGIVASLPCYTKENVDKQRGDGVFERSIAALRLLNGLGYGAEDGELELNLIYNPLGGVLPSPQTTLESDYRTRLAEDWGVRFNHLYTLTNMPIGRFGDWLRSRSQYEQYMNLLIESFNAATVSGLMCLELVSVGWDGMLYDCDFNQALGLAVKDRAGKRHSVGSLASLDELEGKLVRTGVHCFGCTAGVGSSCGGALA
jgi:radical SAM/Cys-rich protein